MPSAFGHPKVRARPPPRTARDSAPSRLLPRDPPALPTPAPPPPGPRTRSHLLVFLLLGREAAGYRAELEVGAGQLVEQMHPGGGSVARGRPHSPRGAGRGGTDAGAARASAAERGAGGAGSGGAQGRGAGGGDWGRRGRRGPGGDGAAPGGCLRDCGAASWGGGRSAPRCRLPPAAGAGTAPSGDSRVQMRPPHRYRPAAASGSLTGLCKGR